MNRSKLTVRPTPYEHETTAPMPAVVVVPSCQTVDAEGRPVPLTEADAGTLTAGGPAEQGGAAC